MIQVFSKQPKETGQLPILISKPEVRMIITQIVRISSVKPPIPLAPIPLPILRPHTHQQNDTSSSTHPQQTQTSPISNRVSGSLLSNEDITRNNAARISKTDHHGTRDGAFVVTRHIILNPSQSHRLASVASTDDHENGEIPHADRHLVLAEEDHVAYRRNADSQNAETKAMPQPVRQPGDYERNNGRDHENGDAAHLRRFGGIAQLLDDGRGEEAGGVARVHNADVHDDAAVDFPVGEDASARGPVEPVHFGVCHVGAEARHEEAPLFVVEEFARFRPVGDEPFGDYGDADGYDAFAAWSLAICSCLMREEYVNSHDEDPPPSTVSAQPIQLRESISEQATEASCQNGSAEKQVQPPL